MRYCKIKTIVNDVPYTFYGQFDNLISYDEIEYYISQAIDLNTDDVDDEELDLEALLMDNCGAEFQCEDMSLNDWLNTVVCDYKHVRPVLQIYVLGNLMDNMVSIYRSYKEDISKTPQYLYMNAGTTGDEGCKYSSACIVKPDQQRVEVIEEGWKDLLSRIKRDGNMGGVYIKTGIFTIFDVPQEDYERYKKNTELVLD